MLYVYNMFDYIKYIMKNLKFNGKYNDIYYIVI